MQPLKITIEGDYWDSYIYMGRLYLWTFDNALYVINWDKLIAHLFTNKSEEFISNTFTKSHSFYDESILKIMNITEVHNTINDLFSKYVNYEFVIKKNEIEGFIFGKQDSPFKNLTSDMEIYKKQIYAATEEGFFSSTTHRSLNDKYLVSSRAKKLWDNKLFSITASGFGQVSLSGGDTGLFEYNLNEENIDQNLKHIDHNIVQISEKHSTFSNYSFISLYNSSNINNAELELFHWNESKEKNQYDNHKKYTRNFSRKFTEEQIFGSICQNSLSWGLQDKIYRATDNGELEIITFDNNDEDENFFSDVTKISLQKWKGKAIGGGVAHFGTIVECENALVILQNNEQFTNIPNSITKWRTFPRSKNYFNQLHVVKDDCLEIYAFYDDFLSKNDSINYRIKYLEKYLR